MTDPHRLGPPPIEPLSDAAWARVERGLWSRLDEPARARPTPEALSSRRWRAIAGPLVLAAALAAIVIITRSAERDRGIAGEPSRVVSGSADAAVSFGDVHIELDPATALVMTRESSHPSVVLEHGAAWFTVAPRQRRPALLVRAGDATIRVVGTRFRVARSAERSVVDVEHGQIEVQLRGARTSVGANQRWSSEAPQRVTAIAGPPGTAPAPVAPTDPVISAAPSREGPDRALPAAASAPGSSSKSSPSPAPVSPASTAEPSARSPASNPAAPAPPRSATALDADRAEYDRLAALEVASPDAALAGYLALARRISAWADPALFAAGRLAADRGDQRAQALLEMYLARFPGGTNAPDARQLLARLHDGR